MQGVKTIAIMQPYFLPYLGYWQLLNAVDEFVIYDNVQFIKNGWIHRNRILVNGTDRVFSLPIEKSSAYLNIQEKKLAGIFEQEKMKILRRIIAAYQSAPYFDQVMPLIESCFLYSEVNLFKFLLHSINMIANYLGIKTPILTASHVPIDHTLRKKDKVIAICKATQGTRYINPIGGIALYNKNEFLEAGVDLLFLKGQPIEYQQFANSFIPGLSIIDVLMFNSIYMLHDFLNMFDLI